MQYFTKKDVDDLSMSGAYNLNGNGTTSWYDTTPGVECFVGDKAIKIDRATKTVISESGRVSYTDTKGGRGKRGGGGGEAGGYSCHAWPWSNNHTVDPCIDAMPGRSTLGYHGPGRRCLQGDIHHRPTNKK